MSSERSGFLSYLRECCETDKMKMPCSTKELAFLCGGFSNWKDATVTQYTSPEIQNELLGIMAQALLREIAAPIKQVKFFTLIGRWSFQCVQQGTTYNLPPDHWWRAWSSWTLRWVALCRLNQSWHPCDSVEGCLAEAWLATEWLSWAMLWWGCSKAGAKSPWCCKPDNPATATCNLYTLLWTCSQSCCKRHHPEEAIFIGSREK